MYANPNPSTSQRRGLYTAKTVNLTASAIAAERAREAELEWGTMDPSPRRVASPDNSRLFDWGMAIALVGMLGGATALAGGTILAAGAVVLLQGDFTPPAAANVYEVDLRDVNRAAEPAVAVAATEAPAAAAEAPAPAKKAAPKRRSRARRSSPKPATRSVPLPTSAPTTPQDGESAMSLSQLKSYLGAGDAPAAAPQAAPPAPVAARPAPAADPVDAELQALLDEPVPAPRASAPAPQAAPPAPARAPVAPAPQARPQGSNGMKMLSSRLAKAPNGVLILDEPFDPVPVAIATDGGAAVYVDGELLGGAPIAVVLDRGTHEIVVQAEKGTKAFEVDASEGAKYCFSVKREPKMGTCR